jgi:tRNA uridine 5-carboxymethylaminomethyl modification enzyme
MFTSRAEYRTLLRQDNADIRLTPIGNRIGLASEERLRNMELKVNASEKMVAYLKETSINFNDANVILEQKGSSLMTQGDKIYKVLSRPEIELEDMLQLELVKNYKEEHQVNDEVLTQVAIEIKYAGYIKKEKNNANKLKNLENLAIPEDYDYNKIKSLSHEAKEKLSKIKPATIAQASRISGVSPSDVSILLIHMGR